MVNSPESNDKQKYFENCCVCIYTHVYTYTYNGIVLNNKEQQGGAWLTQSVERVTLDRGVVS